MLSKKVECIIIVFLFILGLFFRVYNVGEQSLWIDEGYSINAAQAVLEKGLPVLDSGELYGRGVLATYTIAGSMKLFGFDPMNPWSARLPSALFGAGLIIAVYILGKKVFENQIMALLSTVLTTLSTWEIAWSRQARGYSGMQFFALISTFYFYKWLQEKRTRDLFLGTLTLLIAILFHPVAVVFVVPFCAISILEAFKSRTFENAKIVMVALLVLSFFVVLFEELAHVQFLFRSTFTYVVFLATSLLPLSVCLLCSLGFIYFDPTKRRGVIYIATLVIIPVIIFSTYQYSVQMRYLLSVFPFILILASYAIYFLMSRLFQFKNEFILGTISLMILFVINISHITFSPHAVYELEKGSPQPNFKEAYASIGAQKKTNDIIISPYTQMSKIYLKDKGLWLPISLTGKKDEIAQKTIHGTDYYTGAPKINTLPEFTSLLNTKSGFVVFDLLGKTRLGKELAQTLTSFHPTLVYHTGADFNEIWVYRFK